MRRGEFMQNTKLSLYTVFVALSILLAVVAPASAQTMPKVGDMAPDFKLSYFDGKDLKEVSLDQYRGKKNVVVAFFVFAFTGG